MDNLKIIEGISNEYFNMLDEYFGGIYNPEINKFNHTEMILHLKRASKMLYVSLEELSNEVKEFWELNGPKLSDAVKDLDTFTANYSGNLTPLEGISFIKRGALYLDSFLVEDPLFILTKTREFVNEEDFLTRILKHIFNIYDLKDLFYGNESVPLLIIVPPLTELDGKVLDEIETIGLRYFNQLFDSDIDDNEKLLHLLRTYNTPEKFLDKVKEPTLIFNESPRDYLIRIKKSIQEVHKLNEIAHGESFYYKILGQITGISKDLIQATQFKSQLVFDSKEYWNLYNWDNKVTNLDNAIINNIQINEQLKWLGNIDLDKLKNARSEKELNDIRNIFRKSLFQSVSGVEIDVVAGRVIKNIEEAIKEHETKIENMDRTLQRKYSADYISIITGLGVSLTTFTGNIQGVLGLASAAYGFYDYFTGTRKLEKERKLADSSLIGLLIESKK